MSDARTPGAETRGGAPGTSLGNGRRSEDDAIFVPASGWEAKFPLRRCLRDDGGADNDPRVEPELLRKMIESMIWNRELDERLTKLQRQGRIGFHIGSIGEEALMIGSAAALRPSDWIVPCYREMGVALFRGMPLEKILANMYGTADDPVKGRQMPCHYVDREHNFLSISSPVGTQITQAAGVAWAMKLRGSDQVAMVYFGDGATSEGDFHTGLNFAGVYQAPCIFVCRNNQWAISTPLAQQTASETIAQKAIAYGIAGERVDGNDVLAVFSATRDAAERGRRGEGPTLLEMVSYRLGAHSTSDDPRAYRSSEDVEPWTKLDPIVRLERYLEERKLWSKHESEALREKIADELQNVIKKTESRGRPPIESLFSDVFAEQTSSLREQHRELATILAEGYTPKKH